MSLISKKPGMSDSDFIDHWRTHHSDLVKRLPGLLGYRQSLVIDSMPLSTKSYELDGFAELWFSDTQTMKAAMLSSAGRALPDDEQEFLGAITSFATSASDPRSSSYSHYAICSTTGRAKGDIDVLEGLISRVPDVIGVEQNVVEGVIRQPQPPFQMQQVDSFTAIRFAGHIERQTALAEAHCADLRYYLEATCDRVSIVEVDQHRVV